VKAAFPSTHENDATMQLNKSALPDLRSRVSSVPHDACLSLPEKVLQFGTGVLLRGLPDLYIDKANKQGIFNGRIVVVKSTLHGDTDDFILQDGLYTQCIRGYTKGEKIDDYVVNGSISRVLSARSQWDEVLSLACSKDLEIVISNTTESGIIMDASDKIDASPPQSFPGKLLAVLLKRYLHFKGDEEMGLVILPTELIPNNGKTLQSIVLELAHQNEYDPAFILWLGQVNVFCDTLVDRIVPGKLSSADQAEAEAVIGHTDRLMIMSEPYGLWAIETASPKAIATLSFAASDEGVVIAPDISTQRELKLRLLNATHTFCCGIASLLGFTTVSEAMNDPMMGRYIEELMRVEIAHALDTQNISVPQAQAYADTVLDRFRNPHIGHHWLSITMNYSRKMQMRNIPLILAALERPKVPLHRMAFGFAAYLRFMKTDLAPDGSFQGKMFASEYSVHDECASFYEDIWRNGSPDEVVDKALGNIEFWGLDLKSDSAFAAAVKVSLKSILQNGIQQALKECLLP
jgi:tagaturonate reductase